MLGRGTRSSIRALADGPDGTVVKSTQLCDNQHINDPMSAEQPDSVPESEATAKVVSGNGASRSQNGHPDGGLPHLWEGPVHFVMRSFEATMTLPAEEPVDVAATVLPKHQRKRD